jgi:hypothetical protein
MKQIIKKWEKFLVEKTIYTKKDLIDFIKKNPNQKINIDTPKGKTKKFGGLKKIKLKFDYGEWPDLINPADNMGWDLIIIPSATQKNKNLLPIGYVQYHDDDNIWKKVGKEKPEGVKQNFKIIIAPNKVVPEEDKQIIEKFFEKLIQFKKVIWFKGTKKDENE